MIKCVLDDSVNEDVNKSTNKEEDLVKLNSSAKNDTFTYKTSVFEDGNSQLVPENNIEQSPVDVAQADDQKTDSMSLLIKHSQDSCVTKIDEVEKINNKLEQCSTNNFKHKQPFAKTSHIQAILLDQQPAVEQSSPVNINPSIAYLYQSLTNEHQSTSYNELTLDTQSNAFQAQYKENSYLQQQEMQIIDYFYFYYYFFCLIFN